MKTWKRIIPQRRNDFVDKSPSMTDQSFRSEVNVNTIMAKYFKNREWPGKPRGIYTDLSKVPDLMTAYQQVEAAEEAFGALPAEIRESLKNDPRNLERYLADPANLDTAVKYGLIEKQSPAKPAGETTKVEPAQPAAETKP